MCEGDWQADWDGELQRVCKGGAGGWAPGTVCGLKTAEGESANLRAALSAGRGVPATGARGLLNGTHLVHLAVGRLGTDRCLTGLIQFSAWPVNHMHVHRQGEGYFCITNWALHDAADYSKAGSKVERESDGKVKFFGNVFPLELTVTRTGA